MAEEERPQKNIVTLIISLVSVAFAQGFRKHSGDGRS